MEKKKRRVQNIEEARINSDLKALQNRGLLNFEHLDNGEVKVEMNVRAVFDVVNTIGDIPMPVHIYKEIKNKIKHKKKFKASLTTMLALQCIEYNAKGKNLNLLDGKMMADDGQIGFYFSIIDEFYNLDNPIMDLSKPYYWFKVKKEVLKKLENLANNQDPRDFAKYFLK